MSRRPLLMMAMREHGSFTSCTMCVLEDHHHVLADLMSRL